MGIEIRISLGASSLKARWYHTSKYIRDETGKLVFPKGGVPMLPEKETLHQAMFSEKLEKGSVRCRLCSHYCVIAEGKLGVCRVRLNEGGELYTLVYGHTISRNVDPVEKKPLYHFYPGSKAYSIAAPGCNFRCRWCQNYSISQMPREEGFLEGYPASPEEIVHLAQRTGCRSIAYTYTEPTIFFEYAHDIGVLARQQDIANIFVTNGYMAPEMLEVAGDFLDAANVDLKAFHKDTYRRYVGASLQPILDNLKILKEMGVWLEVTTLVIPDLNDDPAELRDAARFIAQELGVDTPWHISRFHPTYRMTDRTATPVRTLQMAAEIGKEEGLCFVYLGNVGGESDTVCCNCGATLVRRTGYYTSPPNLQNGLCPSCRTSVPGVWG